MRSAIRRRVPVARTVEPSELQRQTLRVGLLLAVLVSAIAGLIRATT